MDVALQLLVGAVVGYVLGMIPTGVIVGRSRGVDLTRVGSQRTGATNVLRTLGLRWALVVGLGDILKGTAAVLLAGALTGGSEWARVAAAGFAVLGHTFSPLIGFRGGRGVLTGGGGLIVMSFPAFLGALVCGVTAVALTRYVSLGSLVGTVVAGAIVLAQFWVGDGSAAWLVYATVLPAFIILAHRDNIHRLLNGTERKLSRGRRGQVPGEPGAQREGR